MTQIVNLWTTDNRKFVVVDEGKDTTYSEYLIIALLQTIKKTKTEYLINILLFSNTKCYLEKLFQLSEVRNVKIEDYFSLNLDNEEVDIYEQLTNFVKKNSNSIFIIDCLGTLALQIGVAKTCRFIEKLSNNHILEVFCIYRRDFYQVIPRIETLGNIYVKLRKSDKCGFGSHICYEALVTHKKTSGSIIHWNEFIKQNIETNVLESKKILNDLNIKKEINKSQGTSIKPQASFRLEMSEQEIKQRDSVSLPYIYQGNPERESKIFYVPDDVDFDEEDPDDDLDI